MANVMRFLKSFALPKPYGGIELIEEIAKGGMSRIWKGRRPKSDEIVAVKVLDDDSLEMIDFYRKYFETEEGQIALRLDHPNVIRTYEYGHARKGEYYLVMEYVNGPNLEVQIALQSPRVVEHRLDLLLQMGAGLRYIHERSLVHRDFCPKNVLFGEDCIAKVIDFGLTIPVKSQKHAGIMRAGTASFMAPEQVRGQAVSVRTDIYAYGLSCYEILTGRRPLPGGRDVAKRMQDQLNMEPTPLRRLAPELPSDLQVVLEKCYDKNPAMRYGTMDEVMKEMQQAVDVAHSLGL
jgi:eukaryotic-like serine/threonine-protein kinase